MFRPIDLRLLQDEPTVLAVGCDTAFCQTLKAALRPLDLQVECHASMDDFFEAWDPARPGCIFLEVQHLAEVDRQEVFRHLAQRSVYLPVIVLGVRNDVAGAVRAVRSGAFDFLPRACSQQQLAEAAQEALQWEAEHHAEILERVRIERRLARLNDGERQVLELALQGMSNGGIASYLGLSVRGVENRRSRLMKKMRARSLADLLRQAFAARYAEASWSHRRLDLQAGGKDR